ncbi:MAG: FG-GAP-like repeat-containing protein, partial [Acidobacteriota bacterium]
SAICTTTAGLPNTAYAAALADKLFGAAGCAALAGTSFEIVARFGSTFSNWDFGTTGTPVAGKYSFMTVVMHEIGHGLGFYGSMDATSGSGTFLGSYRLVSGAPLPDIYDRFAVSGSGTPLLSFSSPSAALGAQLVSDNTFFNGANARANNGSVSPKLDTHNFSAQRPSPPVDNGYLRGSSYSHIDDVLYTGTPNGLMTWALGTAEVYTDPGPIMRGMFLDEGWSIASATSPCTYSISPTAVSAAFGGGSGAVALTTQAGCAWTANSNSAFLTITSATSGSGSATVTYSVLANPSTSVRAGTLTIGGQTFTVTQAGRPARRPGVDFNGDGAADIGVYRPEIGRWFVDGGATTDYGIAGDLPVPGDYNGDGTTDIAVFRPSNGTWYINGGSIIVWGAAGDIPVPADYDGNGTTDIAVFRPSTGVFYVRNGITAAFGLAGDLPVPGDYDGDGAADIAVYRPSNGVWYVRNQFSTTYGLAGDIPVPADFNGDGRTDVAVFRPSTGMWFIKDQYSQTWGTVSAGDVPVPLDRSGDGVAELGVFRRSTGTWYFKNHVTDANETVVFGRSGDLPLGRAMPPVQPKSGDFDGDRKADLTVFRPSSGDWVSLRSASGMTDYTVVNWGVSTDIAVARDYDGDNKTDPAIYRPSSGDWYLKSSASGFTTYALDNLGLTGSPVPVPADYDGDGRADTAVFRSSGRWSIRFSSSGTIVEIDFGQAGDLPVPADYDGDGRADPAVFRPSTGRWYLLNRLAGTYTVTDWGLNGDVPAAADFDGDGRADLAVFRPSLGRWFIKSSIDGAYTTADWGLSGDTLVPADYDGDGKADIAVFRPSTGMWYVRGLFNRSWGLAGDVAALKNP